MPVFINEKINNCFILNMFVFQKAGADMLELNLSCPHGMGEKGMGLACGQVRPKQNSLFPVS